MRGEISAVRPFGECRFQTTTPRLRLKFHFPAPGLKGRSGLLLPSPRGVLVLASFGRINYLWDALSDSAPGVAPVPLPQAPQAPKGRRPLCFHRAALPHHESLPINAPVCAGGAGAMRGKTWAGLCALQLQRQQQPSPPRLEII